MIIKIIFEPMLVGLFFAVGIHLFGLFLKKIKIKNPLLG